MKKRMEKIKKEKIYQDDMVKKINKQQIKMAIPRHNNEDRMEIKKKALKYKNRIKKKNIKKENNYVKETNRDKNLTIAGTTTIKEHKIKLRWLSDHLTIWDFIDKGSVFYGTTETGKTFFIYDLMYQARNIFHKVIVFAPTNEERHDFDNVIPKALIYETFGLEDIEKIYQHQKDISAVYNMVNKQEILLSLFSRVANHKEKEIMDLIFHKKTSKIRKIEEYGEVGTKRNSIEQIEKKYNTGIKAVAKKTIRSMRNQLESMNLSKEEKYTLKYLDLNPRILVIFDDAMMEINNMIRIGKKNHDYTIKNFFFKGRHAFITHFYAFQDDTKIDPDMRKNSHINVFTDPNCAHSFFSRSSNGFGKIIKKQAEVAIDAVFDEGEPYEKLIFIKKYKDPFFYQIAQPHEEFHMCEKNIREYCEKIEAKENFVDPNNPFLEKI